MAPAKKCIRNIVKSQENLSLVGSKSWALLRGRKLTVLLDSKSQNVELIELVRRSEKQIRNGKFIKVNSSVTEEEIDKLLTS